MSLGFIAKPNAIAIGRIFFAVGLIGIGCQHFFFRQFIPVVVPMWPAWIPGRPFWVYLAGAILIAAGASILSGFKARTACLLLAVLFLASVVLLHIPANVMAHITSLIGWSDTIETLNFAGSALVVAGTFAEISGRRSSTALIRLLAKLIPLGFYTLVFEVIVFGFDHFLYVRYVKALVPAWIPGHVFWTYFAGAALIASGLGMIFRVKARLAATLLGAMLFTWVLVLHIPRAIANPYGGIGDEWTSVFEALAFSGIAFILGETLGEKLALHGSGKSV